MNKQNLKPNTDLTPSELSERGRKAGIASGEARREKKALRELLRDELAKDGGGGLTKAQWLVAKALDNHAKGKLTFKDLKDLQDLLGESVQNINLTQNELPKGMTREQAIDYIAQLNK